MKKMLLLIPFFIMSGCQQSNTASRDISPISEHLNQNLSGEFTPVVPEFRKSGENIEVVDPKRGVVFSYNPSKLIDIDNQRAIQSYSEQEIERDTEIINTGISGAFESGLYSIAGEKALSDPLLNQKMGECQLAKPVKVDYLNEGIDDYYVVPVIHENRIVAGAKIQEANDGSLTYGGASYATTPVDQLPTISNEMTAAVTQDGAYSIASRRFPGFSVSSTNAQLERIDFKSIYATDFLNFMWRIKGSPSPYFVNSTGQVFKASAGYATQGVGYSLPSTARVELTLK